MTFLKKIKNTELLRGAKFKFKTHLLNTFFFAPFFASFASKFEKSTKYDQILFLIKKGIKNAEFHADLKSDEKVKKNTQKKVKQNKFDEHG